MIKYLGVLSVLVIVGLALITIYYPIIPVFPLDADYRAIEETLYLYDEIDDHAECTLDDSRLVEVLANDPRGGMIQSQDVQLVQHIMPNIPVEQIGALDVRRSYYGYLRLVKEIYERAVTDERFPPTISPFQIPEIQALMTATGRQGASLPDSTCLETAIPDKFLTKTINVTLTRNLAYAVIEFTDFTSRLVFIKMNGHWYLVGGQGLQMHAG